MGRSVWAFVLLVGAAHALSVQKWGSLTPESVEKVVEGSSKPAEAVEETLEQTVVEATVEPAHVKDHFFAHVYFINLEARKDRRDAMEKQIGAAGLDLTRVVAREVNEATAIKDDRFKRYLGNRALESRLSGASKKLKNFLISVNIAHMETYEQVMKKYEGSDKPVLILEDDVVLKPGWEEDIERQTASVPADYDLVRVSTWGATRDADLVTEGVYKASAPFKDKNHIFYSGMHATIIKPSHVPHILRYLKAKPITDIDDTLTAYGDSLKSYVMQNDMLEVGTLSKSSDHPPAADLF